MIYLLLIAKASKLWLIHSIDVSFKHTDTCWLSSKMYITKCKSYLKQREHFVLYISFKKMFSHSLPPPLKKNIFKELQKERGERVPVSHSCPQMTTKARLGTSQSQESHQPGSKQPCFSHYSSQSISWTQVRNEGATTLFLFLFTFL